jgi:hypothetical protein
MLIFSKTRMGKATKSWKRQSGDSKERMRLSTIRDLKVKYIIRFQ